MARLALFVEALIRKVRGAGFHILIVFHLSFVSFEHRYFWIHKRHLIKSQCPVQTGWPISC